MAKSALVTGGTGSVGSAIVRALCSRGYQVDFVFHQQSARASSLSLDTGARAICHDLGLQSPPSIDFRYDVLVNCAAILLSKTPIEDVSDEEYERTLAINLRAPFLLSRAALPYMKEQRWGRIVNIGSIYSVRGSGSNGSYNMSKHGLSGLTKSIALDYAAHGVTCNEVCPSAIESDLMRDIAARKEREGVTSADAYLDAVREANPMRRLADPTDVANAVLYLVSDAAEFVNGISLPVDGGQIA